MRLLNRKYEAEPAADNSRQELVAAREEIRKLQKALEDAQAELNVWYDNGILLSEEDKMYFYARYQDVKWQEWADEQMHIQENQAELEKYLSAYKQGGDFYEPDV